ncbi:putative chromosome partition protein SMC [Selenomonas ruminantium subsp. lactilytica TAM6421]|uniref:Chromosome partition protein Smc n=1 Tax=Selenomonas ruminantium subsp. lactilytica (strain NBRC 103574 / TAM6421) TaxID=927704 RepID=I0GPN1_SELRL|nr:chromosome segregation protein SMC [Selenomonas ruminantium]BAL82718.1 putative chromosome partition protein SMC [Selenomonas ruminantium subsp. lactilytica TAM6421]
MQLKRLEAYGFKSFADKITIDFDQGITAIVGPNGSGKSNITDAIRWVLGEQNVRNLRGTKAEDIIFTGSASRKALGVAEVSLFFANDGTLPVDFREVVVTRRLYRNGDSEFYINRSRCRLKDIYNLFADTGIGHDGMSIIGQNRIDDILNSRPEDRRAFFEETAGITKYRNRKRESVRKLTDTENNLVRVQDIIHEIENQLEPLSRHAEKTRIYNGLNEEYRRCKLAKLSFDYGQEAGKRADNEAKLTKFRDELLAADTHVQALAAEKEKLHKDIIDLEQKLQAQAARNESLRQKMEEAAREMAKLQERQDQSDEMRNRILERRKSLNSEIARMVAEIAQLTSDHQQQKQDLALLDELLVKEQAKQKKFSQLIREQEQAERELEEERAQQLEVWNARKQEYALAQRDLENSEGDQESREDELYQAREKLADLEDAQDVWQKKLQQITVSFKADEEKWQQTAAHRKNAEAEQAQILRELNHNSQQLHTAENKLQFLTRMQQAYEGFGKAVKAVLKSQESWRKGVAGAVAELIDVPRDYVTAIEVALGGNLQNVVTQDTDTAKAAISFLKRERQGRVTFLPLSTLVVRQSQSIREGRDAGVIGWANTLVRADSCYQKAIDFLLARTLVVDNLDNALKIARDHEQRLRIVTLSGELLNPGGSLSGGSRQHAEASFLNRSGEIEDLKGKITSLQAESRKLTALRDERTQQLQALEHDMQQLQDNLQQQRISQAELETNLQAAGQNLTEQQTKVAAIEEALQTFQKSFARMQEKKVLAKRAAAEAEGRYQELDKDLEKAREKLEDLVQDAEDLRRYINDREIKRAALEQEILGNTQFLQLRAKAKTASEEALKANEQEERDLDASLVDSVDRLKVLDAQQHEWQDSYDEGQAAHDDIYKERMDKLEASQEADKQATVAAQQRNRLQDAIQSHEIAQNKLDMKLESLQETILAEYGLTPERAAEEAMEGEPAEIKANMQQLERKLKELGPVNPNALEEFEELQKRHDFMEKQAGDLNTAKEDLEKILADMDEAMTKQFKEAFAQIQVYFGEIFVRLFGGGKAELQLTDKDDVLNAGVDILVTLPQKKRQNLSALSGGERALTVIALLFSFLRYRPSPFSVLDEIDAPLDEANVVRFGSFLKEFAENTQFIVVTHRKGTMEAVDTLYGVTIEDAGVSKILSVKIDEVE